MTGSSPQACPNCGADLRPNALFCAACGTPASLSPDDTLQRTLLQLLVDLKPGQAEVIRRCAVPRWFDADILGVLRDREDGQNSSILAQLADYSFVRHLGEQRYAYNVEVRDLLLHEWDHRPAELRAIQQRLYNYFEHRMESTSLENRATWLRELVSYDLALATTPTNGVPPAPPAPQLSDQPHLGDLPGPAVAMPLRTQRALNRFRNLFEQAERGYRLAEAEALLVAAEEQASLTPELRDWLLYYRARLDYANADCDTAVATFGQLLNDTALDSELRGLATIALGNVLVEIGSWSRAIEIYRAALALPGLDTDQQAAVHLGLSDAYNEIAVSVGGWHIPAYQSNRWRRWITHLGQWLLTVPMLLLTSLLRRVGAVLPPTAILARYQNWLLARIFRAAREELQTATRLYTAQHDEYNVARCGIRLVTSDITFGLTHDAVARGRALLLHASAQDSYVRARMELSLAAALHADTQNQAALPYAEQALHTFQAVGDGRWAARALTLIGRIWAQIGDADAALRIYTQALEQARAIHSTLSRERILYELRSWLRADPNAPAGINAVLYAEPVQRFVGRFPKFLLPIFQFGLAAAVPVTLFLTAMITPLVQPNTSSNAIVRTASNLLLPAAETVVFSMWRFVLTLLLVVLVAGLAYTLLALAVLWRMPLKRLEQEQPDVLVLDSAAITRFDHHNVAAQRLCWSDIDSIISANASIWRRPLAPFSRTWLLAHDGTLLGIDGIVSWYNTLRRLIHTRIEAAGNRVRNIGYDMALLRGWSGLIFGLGLLLLLLLIASSNGWVPDLATLLPPTLYAVLYQLAYSGLLLLGPMVHGLIGRPLRIRRTLALHDRLPLLVAAIGAGLVLLFLLSAGRFVPIPGLSMALFMVGLYILTEASYSFVPRTPFAQRSLAAVQVLVLLIGMVLIVGPLKRSFYSTRSYAYATQGQTQSAASDRAKEAMLTSPLIESAPLDQAAAATLNRSWNAADDQYAAIVNDPNVDDLTRAMAQHNRVRAALEQCALDPRRCPDPVALERNELRAIDLGLRTYPEAHSVALETLADIYFLGNNQRLALAALDQARSLTTDSTRRALLDRRIAQGR